MRNVSMREFLASIPAWGGLQRLDLEGIDKDALLAAEVTLPLEGPFDAARLRVAEVRPPFELRSRLLLVDVSRLPAP